MVVVGGGGGGGLKKMGGLNKEGGLINFLPPEKAGGLIRGVGLNRGFTGYNLSGIFRTLSNKQKSSRRF